MKIGRFETLLYKDNKRGGVDTIKQWPRDLLILSLLWWRSTLGFVPRYVEVLSRCEYNRFLGMIRDFPLYII